MIGSGGLRLAFASASIALLLTALPPAASFAQEQTAAADAAEDASSPKPLSDDELEVLVARIALYPDELVALISGASLYPLQIVEAARFLEQYQKDKSLKPKDGWDGSVVSLLNYPEIVKMMSDDLDWTQAFGNAIAYQQKDVLVAIQQLRDEAVAKGIIKSDDKVQVSEENENVVIRPADPEKVYVPRYEPEMLYVEDYAPAPISYYPEPYPYYWYPTATFFAGAITGAFWGAVVDWDDWGVWGGDWDGGDIDIDCNHCFNNRDFNGKIDFNDVDWNNIDRDKINIDRDKLNNFDRNEFKNRVKQNGDNALRDRAKDIKRAETRDRPGNRPGGTKDVRKSVQDGLKAQGGAKARPAGDKRPAASKPANRKAAAKGDKQRPQASRKGGKPKPGQRADNRPKKSSGLGNPQRGKSAKISSNRGHKSMGGGQRGGPRKVHGGRGGGGRGGGGRRR
ncbi:DUF3300 domain-containing protein [Mesorhizobium sp. YM1C-6-2]|uniref:DUF3300 domain-containing protein n=1 Tax=Mesorhizobium sp. YM1C-6-2 TaxID=1827501 RepID=UPI000EF1D5AE|nr:DUF3300 domain-containing protein [Mesorhizobium sp. YM1C-6-2]RLP24636.1 DUF3300 domain-containing protein [Mesorhizobium sp. YM1C-6-2]